ncbi:MAG: hypothetical protein RSI33_13415, partial [Clostridia bacterium]
PAEPLPAVLPVFEQPSFEPYVFEQPFFNQPALNHPAFEQPSFEQPTFEHSSFEHSSFEQPTFEHPSFEHPSFEHSSFEHPSFEHSSFEQPAFELPASDQPAFEPYIFDEPLFDQPASEQPPYADFSPSEVSPFAWQNALTAGMSYGKSFSGEGEFTSSANAEIPFITDEIEAFFDDAPAFTAPDEQPAASAPAMKPAQAITPAQPACSTQSTQPARSTQSNRNTKPTQPARSTQSNRNTKPTHPAQPARSTQSTHSAKTIQPAKALKSTPSAPPKPQPSHPPIRPWRLISLVLATAMLLFCIIIGGKMVSDLAGNERQMLAVRQDYLERKGVALDSDAMRVELPPPGVTFEPTQAPALVETPSPEPVFIINDAAAVSLNHRDTSNVSEPAPVTPTPNPRTKQFSYPDNPLLNIMASIQAAHAENADVVGHVVIDGLLDEAVVMRNNTYYLNHSAQGSPSESGAVFIDESCALRFPPENLLLRGQSAIAGKVFAPLWRFKEDGSAFVASATTLKLTTLYEETHFVLFAVIVAGSTPGLSDYFNFASHPSFASDQSMLDYVQSAKEHSLYQFKVDVDATDRLLTLATLGNSTSNQSLVLLYRMLRPGEAPR